MKKTKIICTIGPVTESPEMLRKLIKGGMNVARLNFSHSDHQTHGKIIQNIAQINKELENPVAIMLDTKGPEIRTNHIHGKLQLKKGDEIVIAVGSICDEQEKMGETVIGVNYGGMINDLKKGDSIVLNNGIILAEVIKKDKTHLHAKVLNAGKLSNKRHVNLPGAKVNLPVISSKDKEDILFGIKHQVDFIALSFVRSAKDIKIVRKILKKHKSKAKIIAKIEDRQAVINLKEIIMESDGVMVARGDLGIEISYAEVPMVQKQSVAECIRQGKPVIVATHLLESMIENPLPTRAEVSDIATAVWELSDAIMLSGETTTGRFPLKSLQIMSQVATKSEEGIPSMLLHEVKEDSSKKEIARSACLMADKLKVGALVCFSETGETAKAISNFRPQSNIFVFAKNEVIQRELALYRGVICFKKDFKKGQWEKNIKTVIKFLRKKKLLKKGEQIVVVTKENRRVEGVELWKIS